MSATHSYQWLCQKIVEASPIAVIYGDRQGRIQLWNTGAEAMFGYTAQEAIGQSMDLIIPEKHRPRHWAGYDKVMQTGVTKYGRDLLAVPALTKDGRRISVEFNVALVRGEDGAVTGAAATIQDVSARWDREKSTKARIVDLENRLKQAGLSVEPHPAAVVSKE